MEMKMFQNTISGFPREIFPYFSDFSIPSIFPVIALATILTGVLPRQSQTKKPCIWKFLKSFPVIPTRIPQVLRWFFRLFLRQFSTVYLRNFSKIRSGIIPGTLLRILPGFHRDLWKNRPRIHYLNPLAMYLENFPAIHPRLTHAVLPNNSCVIFP